MKSLEDYLDSTLVYSKIPKGGLPKTLSDYGIDIDETQPRNRHVFVRLYRTEFKKHVDDSKKTLAKGITQFSKVGRRGFVYTHAAVNYRLLDRFYGLNENGPKNGKFVLERIAEPYKDDSIYSHDKDYEKSLYDVYALPLREKEYELFKQLMLESITQNKTGYDYIQLVKIAARTIKERLQLMSRTSARKVDHFKGFLTQNEEKWVKDMAQIDQKLVCSSYATWLFATVSQEFRDWLAKEKIDFKYVSPSDLSLSPELVHLFGGFQINYDNDLNDFIRKNPNFAKEVN